MTLKKKNIIKFTIISIVTILLTITFGKTYAKYVLTRNFDIDVSSAPFYFDVEPKNSKIFIYKDKSLLENPTLDLVIKNHDGNNCNPYEVSYNIFTDDSNITFVNETTKTISGGSKKDEELKLEFKIKNMDNIPDNIVVKISTTKPYSKTIELNIKLQEVFKVTYNGFEIDTDEFPQEIEKGKTLTVDFSKCKKGILKVKMNGEELQETYFTFKDFKIPNVYGDIEITYTKMKLGEVLRAHDPEYKISEDLVGGMYRYQGTKDDKINNYICFGTDDKNKCLSDLEKYMYRIIGITEDGELYLIKMDGVVDGEIKTFSWEKSCCEPNTWDDSLLFKRLNGKSNGEDHNFTGNSNIFIGNSHYDYMEETSEWYKKIEAHNWMYGDVSDISKQKYESEFVYGAKNSGETLYKIERGILPTLTYDVSQKKYAKYLWKEKQSVNAKIGLMYLHDYYLAYDSETDWSDTGLSGNNWISTGNNNIDESQIEMNEWLISRNGVDTNNTIRYAWMIDGLGHSSTRDLGYFFKIRPVFYLQPGQTIGSGEGTREDPFILSLETDNIN